LLTVVCHNLEQYLAQARTVVQGITCDRGMYY